MKRLMMLIAAIVLIAAPAAFAETNGQEQAASDVVRTSSTQAVTAITSRIATVAGAGARGGQINQVAKLDDNGNFNFSTNAKEIGIASGDAANNIGIWGMGVLHQFQQLRQRRQVRRRLLQRLRRHRLAGHSRPVDRCRGRLRQPRPRQERLEQRRGRRFPQDRL